MAPNAEQEMSQNAPATPDCVRQTGLKESPNSDRAAGGRAHPWWHPELIFRRGKSTSSRRSVQLPLFISTLSRKADVGLSTVRRLWHDPYRHVDFYVLERLARALDVPVTALIEDVPGK